MLTAHIYHTDSRMRFADSTYTERCRFFVRGHGALDGLWHGWAAVRCGCGDTGGHCKGPPQPAGFRGAQPGAYGDGQLSVSRVLGVLQPL